VRLQPAKVYIDGKLATGITVSKDGKTLIMTVPAHAAGKVDITVTTKDGSFTFPQSYEYIPGGNTSKGFVIFGGDSSVLTAAGKASLDKLIKGIPKGAVDCPCNSDSQLPKVEGRQWHLHPRRQGHLSPRQRPRPSCRN